ncbi:hypothetical protein OIU77_023275 [Salix suchowensis]|uniref:Uncharacterized protein n=1 Tax=Salix suchowensis TaxID=1278906 RepID=A0ABQ9C383_9ROSI|nr:hypothetical protein OIU77_023275 [Salix suchowensis]
MKKTPLESSDPQEVGIDFGMHSSTQSMLEEVRLVDESLQCAPKRGYRRMEEININMADLQ